MIKVSVVVPVYNTGKYLEKCLDSLVNQTLAELELVVVDDGSTDNSPEIIRRYAEQYPARVRAFRQENGGQAVARNAGIRECRGEYIGFMDSDDYVEKEMFERLYLAAVRENADLAECTYRYVKAEGDRELPLKPYGSVRNYRDNRDMFRNPLVSPWNKLYRAELLRKDIAYFPEGRIYEDTAFFIKLIPYVKKSVLVEEPFVTHILREGSTMTINKSRRIGDIFPVLEDILSCYEKAGEYGKYRDELEYFCVKILLCSSLERISRIEDAGLRKEFLGKTLGMIGERFPGYRKNPYMRSGKKELYMRTVNKFSIGLYCGLFRLLKVEHGGRARA